MAIPDFDETISLKLSEDYRQIEPSAEGLIALSKFKKQEEENKILILPIQYRLAKFYKLNTGDILCTLQIPYKIMKVKYVSVEDRMIFVSYTNYKPEEKTSEWLREDEIENGDIGVLILE